MSGIITLLCIFVIGLCLIIAFVRWYSEFCYRHIVSKPTEILDGLLLTGEVPSEWRKRRLERLSIRMKGRGGEILQHSIVRYYAGRLRRMMNFARGNHRISSEEAQNIGLALKELSVEWENTKLSELVDI